MQLTPTEIVAFRARLGLSQSRLAELLPVSKRALENWEQGYRSPPTVLPRALRDVERELTAKPPQ